MASKTLVSKYVKLRLITETFDTPRIVMNLDVQKDYVLLHIFTTFLTCNYTMEKRIPDVHVHCTFVQVFLVMFQTNCNTIIGQNTVISSEL